MSREALYELMSTQRVIRRLRPDPVPDDVLQRVLHVIIRRPAWARCRRLGGGGDRDGSA